MVRKASPSKASPVFTAPPHRLDSEARQELWTLLGYSAAQLEAAAYPGYKKLPSPLGAPLQLVKADNPKPFAKDPYKAVLEVETSLGLYKAGLLHLNQIPGPADYRLAFRPVRDLAASTLNQICSWSDYYRDQFKFRSVDFHQIETALAILADTTQAILKELPEHQQAGRRTDRALRDCVRRLRLVFRDFYIGRFQ